MRSPRQHNKRALELRSYGLSLRQIARQLEAEGIFPLHAPHWSAGTVNCALGNQKPKTRQVRNGQYLIKYGLSIVGYEELLERQGGACAICGDVCPSGRRLAVDHDHETKRIRGLLCSHHNLGLGHFSDDPVLLRAAADYLEAA